MFYDICINNAARHYRISEIIFQLEEEYFVKVHFYYLDDGSGKVFTYFNYS